MLCSVCSTILTEKQVKAVENKRRGKSGFFSHKHAYCSVGCFRKSLYLRTSTSYSRKYSKDKFWYNPKS